MREFNHVQITQIAWFNLVQHCGFTNMVKPCTMKSPQGGTPRAEYNRAGGNEMELDSMTQTELASYLETLARLVEATAKDPQDAARIIRDAIPKQ